MNVNRLGAAAPLILGAALLTGACEPEGKVRVTWSFTDGEITGAADCSRRGVDRITVTLTQENGHRRYFEYPCGQGASGAETVATGTYQATVQAFGPTGLPFEDPATGEVALIEVVSQVVVSEGGDVTEVEVTFTPNPECADGVDNDRDGLVDAADPGCRDKNGDYDPSPTRTEEDASEPGVLAVTWSINGGRDACEEVQPEGAATASVLADGLEVGRFDCAVGEGTIPLPAGGHGVLLRLLDDSDVVLAETPSQEATLIGGMITTLGFDVELSDFDPLQTGALLLSIAWESSGGSCGDASPVVESQALILLDPADQAVDATLLSGLPPDGTEGTCVPEAEIQGIDEFIGAGLYHLTVAGYSPSGGECWLLADEPVRVDIGPNPLHYLVVPRVDATGLCAP